jgi:hypothetical protein
MRLGGTILGPRGLVEATTGVRKRGGGVKVEGTSEEGCGIRQFALAPQVESWWWVGDEPTCPA